MNRQKITIHASQFYNYFQCPTRVYLNIYGNTLEKVPVTDFTQKRIDEGLVHEREVISDKDFVEVNEKTDIRAFEKTMELMALGTERIYQGVLIKDNLIGRPDFLEKRKGKSKFGDHYYVACDIKSGKHIREEYRLQVTFYSYMLELIQGRLPLVGRIINSQKKEIEFNVADEMNKFKAALSEISSIVAGKMMDPFFSSKCIDCVWRKHCILQLESKEDLSLVYKLTREHKEKLQGAGISNLTQLANIDVYEIKKHHLMDSMPLSLLERFKISAKALIEKKPILIQKPKIAQTNFEIFFDIEGETELGIDYLYGVMVCQKGKEQYYSFWADSPADEKTMWDEFCKFMSKLDNYKIYYYTHYETTSLRRLKDRYGMNAALYKKITSNMIDIFKIMSSSVILPLYSYTIKSVAKYLGFSWDAEDASGTQSIIWYYQWSETKDKKIKQKIIDYNRNDCEAMQVLLDFLKKQ